MSNYRTFFIPSEKQKFKRKMEGYTNLLVDGENLSAKIQSLLFEYEQLSYELHSMQAIQSTASSFTYTEGMIVVLKKSHS
ncbi:hypothetical protein N9B82_01400 [Saprospiraceae bacterium]|nr:hypothetical protein [Saprospiraceae bacterium]